MTFRSARLSCPMLTLKRLTVVPLLTEMAGFDGNTGVIVLVATDHPDVLDAALLHPGRFDQQATVMTWMAVLRSSACTHAVRPSGPMLT